MVGSALRTSPQLALCQGTGAGQCTSCNEKCDITSGILNRQPPTGAKGQKLHNFQVAEFWEQQLSKCKARKFV